MLSRRNAKRAANAAANVQRAATWDPAKVLFGPQLAVYRDPAQYRVVSAGRSSGKSYGAAVELVDTALNNPGCLVMFCAPTQTDAQNILAEPLEDIETRFSLGMRISKGKVLFPNGSRLLFVGAKDARDGQRQFRGKRPLLVWVDEIQFFPSFVRDMVNSAIQPSLLRKGIVGRLVVSGTPSVVPLGWWFERQSDPSWRNHGWTYRANPTLPADAEAKVQEAARSMGGVDSAAFRREYLCDWHAGNDGTGLCFRYDPLTNDFDVLPGGTWRYYMGLDLGFKRDRCALVVIGITDAAPGKVWLVDEYVSPPRNDLKPYTTSDFATVIGQFRDRYAPQRIVCDEGGLGGAIADEYRVKYRLPITPAEKHDPEVSIQFVADDLAAGNLMIRRTSRVAEDMAVLRWDPIQQAEGKLVEAKTPHSDVIPSLRYVYKHARAHLIKAPPPVLSVKEQERENTRKEIKDSLAKKRRFRSAFNRYL